MTKKELNARVDAEILTGMPLKDISEKYDMPYPTVAKRSKDLNATEVDGTLRDDNITKATLEIIRDKIAVEAPKVAKQADAILDGLEGIKILNRDIQEGLSKVVKLANKMLDEVEYDDEGNEIPMSKRDLQLIASILTSVYSAINAKGTTVNVAQTNVSSQGENLAYFSANLRSV